MAEALAILKQKRGQQKAALKRTQNFVDSLVLREVSNRQVFELKARFDKLSIINERFEEIQNEIELKDSSEEVYRQEFETEYYSLVSAIQEVIENCSISSNAKPVEDSQEENRRAPSFQLPLIKLPNFDGNYQDWLEFRDSFKALVDANQSLSGVQKLHHLRSCLTTEALNTIKSIPVTNENYNLAWRILTERYEKGRIISDNHVKSILNCPKVVKECSRQLRNLHTTVFNNLEALKNLNAPVQHWDLLLIPIITSKLDPRTLQEWERFYLKAEQPTVKDLLDLIRLRCDLTEKLENNKPNFNDQSLRKPENKFKQTINHITANPILQCYFCQGNHAIYKCQDLLKLSPEERLFKIQKSNLCINCLKPNHKVTTCTSSRCKVCKKKHNTILHNESKAEQDQKPSVAPAVLAHTQYNKNISINAVILATAVVRLRSSTGQEIRVRALLDQGSEISLISETIAQQLQLQRHQASIPLKGIGAHTSGRTNGVVSIQLLPHFSSDYNYMLKAYILPKLTMTLPSTAISSSLLSQMKGLTLADPHFFKPGKIDLLIGADVYGQLLQPELIQTGINSPTAQCTKIGWIISGCASNYLNMKSTSAVTSLHCCIDHELHSLIKTFWEQETVEKENQRFLSPEEEECERHFIETHRRDSSGRYVVRLPFKGRPEELGESEPIAKKSLNSIQKKLTSNQMFRDLYSEFMQEYEKLGHMVLSSVRSKQLDKVKFYLPHHGVLRESSSTTKLRVVFNGSSKTSTGISLNDILHVGAKLQRNIADVIQWWRRYRYVFVTDIEKMFRQIAVAPEDQTYQRILWSPDPAQKPQEYCLTTVTYGLASAPYLANRVIQQLAQDEGSNYPLALPVIKNGIYVDDLFGGADTVEEARLVAHQLKSLGMAGGFNLHKWSTNNREIFGKSNDVSTNSEVSFQFRTTDTDTIRTLGIIWEPQSDNFLFKPPIQTGQPPYTKRKVLSSIAQLFDPLGWVTPVTIKAKILLQEIWLTQIDWDDILPESISSIWIEFLNQLQHISSLSVPRWVFYSSQSSAMEIHGFADASESALAAVVYLRVMQGDSSVKVSLLQAKSKVAPLKRMTIPRLELTAAVLLVQQTAHIIQIMNLSQVPVHLWTDSSVTLTWVQGHPSKWKDFISNRVSKIQETLPLAHWHHVTGRQNPADCASRGYFPKQLKDHSLWWNGPDWLHLPRSSWPTDIPNTIETVDLEERPKTVALTHCEQPIAIWNLVSKYSNLITLLRVTALCRRFLTKRFLKSNPLTSAEIYRERQFWIRVTQLSYFASQFKILSQGKSLLKSDPLIKLNPFIDESELLRVGGRLKNSLLHPDQKHPFILPRNSDLTTLIIREAHEKTLHGGTQLTLAYIRQTCWIIGGRAPVKSFILRCVRCARWRGTSAKQLMGQLPAIRTFPSRPFLHSGVDYAGPFYVKSWKGRRAKVFKGYIVLFVCLSTSALHLDLVTEYTVEGFLAAYRRFSSRRGICATLTSDCGTNLVGANTELKKLFSRTSKELGKLALLLANDGTTWKFNPPSAPHFGGKWEAGVKSVKHHLRRIIGDIPMTYEEFATLLSQIEAVLNSRPLCPMSEDPEDLEALTPSHFLVGSPLTSIPEPSLEPLSITGLQRWRLVQKMFQTFWQRWKKEYLQRFLSISKWTSPMDNIKQEPLFLSWMKDILHRNGH